MHLANSRKSCDSFCFIDEHEVKNRVVRDNYLNFLYIDVTIKSRRWYYGERWKYGEKSIKSSMSINKLYYDQSVIKFTGFWVVP